MRWPWNMLSQPQNLVLRALGSRSSLFQAFFPVSGHPLESLWWTYYLPSFTITLTQTVSESWSAMPRWHRAGHFGMRDQCYDRHPHFGPSPPLWHLSYFQTYCASFMSLLWAHQISHINPDCCLHFKAERSDRACFKRSFLLFVENNSSQSKTESERQCPGQNLPGNWGRGRCMETYLDTTRYHGPDAIICKYIYAHMRSSHRFLLSPAGTPSQEKYSEPEPGRC